MDRPAGYQPPQPTSSLARTIAQSQAARAQPGPSPAATQVPARISPSRARAPPKCSRCGMVGHKKNSRNADGAYTCPWTHNKLRNS